MTAGIMAHTKGMKEMIAIKNTWLSTVRLSTSHQRGLSTGSGCSCCATARFCEPMKPNHTSNGP